MAVAQKRRATLKQTLDRQNSSATQMMGPDSLRTVADFRQRRLRSRVAYPAGTNLNELLDPVHRPRVLSTRRSNR